MRSVIKKIAVGLPVQIFERPTKIFDQDGWRMDLKVEFRGKYRLREKRKKKIIKWVFCKNPNGRRHESGVVEFGGEG